ncbi:hypothetical protein [uncultured Cohaesibacter sp.]|uniref:hypothetical protein n=1 Tax=uncultured Cohaesibacter sp. TaxID=1002546 RepID=UPI0029C8F0E3|nr:hypothetical protein [uncultured Cohaesibacter sp.]
MKNRKLIVTSEIINALIDKNGGPIDLTTIFEMIKERTGMNEEDFGGEAYLILGMLRRFNFIQYGERFEGIEIGPNFDDKLDYGLLPQRS